MSWRELSPRPFTLWARWEPKAWRRPDWLHLDPMTGAMRSGGESAGSGSVAVEPPEPPDVVYLPPVDAPFAVERDALARRVADAGGHALVHLRAGEAVAPLGATPIVDLLEPFASGAEPDRLELPRGAWVIFPLVAGLVDAEGERRRWLARLAVGGAAVVVGALPAITPSDRRLLADRAGEERWQAIFHGEPPDERAFARAVFESGVASLPPPPELAFPPRSARNRRLAAWLAEAGELTLRLGKGEAGGEALLAASRHAATASLDFAALAREGNLAVVDWLDEAARRLVEQAAASPAGAPPADLVRLRAEWHGETP